MKISRSDIKCIAIKLPFDLQERILSFPFLHVLREKYPEAELHLITPKLNIEILNLLPFSAYYHEFDENEIQTIFDVHRFCVNAKINNVDLFVSLTNSFLDACLGIGFRARHRLGFSDGWKTLVFNQKTLRPLGHHICEDFFSLYKAHLSEEVNLKLKIISRELPSQIPDWDQQPYLAINLSPLRNGSIDEEWIDLVNRFTGQKFIFFVFQDQEKLQFITDDFIKKLSKRNMYQFYIYSDLIELSKVFAYARGIITRSGAMGALAAYTGTKTIIIYEQENPQKSGPLYFMADTLFLTHELSSAGAKLEARKSLNVEEVATKVFDFLRLSTQ